MITKSELIRISKKTMLRPYLQEKHYIQSILLSGIYSHITNELIFKGGTALFFFYGLNRFSEDLDFSLNGVIEKKKLKKAIADRFEILDIEHRIKDITSKTGKNLKIKAQGPLYTKKISLCIVDVEISERKDVVRAPEVKEYFPIYNDIRPFTLPVMGIKEILAEKVRAIIKRKKARDVYDMMFLLKKGTKIDFKLVNKKMQYYGEKFDAKTFKKKLLEKKDMWKSELRGLVKTVPDFNKTSKFILKNMSIK